MTKAAYENGNVQGCAFPMGQAAGLISEILPAAEIIGKTVEEARSILNNANSKI